MYWGFQTCVRLFCIDNKECSKFCKNKLKEITIVSYVLSIYNNKWMLAQL